MQPSVLPSRTSLRTVAVATVAFLVLVATSLALVRLGWSIAASHATSARLVESIDANHAVAAQLVESIDANREVATQLGLLEDRLRAAEHALPVTVAKEAHHINRYIPFVATSLIDTQIVDVCSDAIEAAFADPMSVARGARIVPSIHGNQKGFKLYAVRPNSIYAALGLHNGDRILTINGIDLTSPDKALELYSKRRESSYFDIELTRRGARHRIVVLPHANCAEGNPLSLAVLYTIAPHQLR